MSSRVERRGQSRSPHTGAAASDRLLGWKVNERVEVLAVACPIDAQTVAELEQRVQADHAAGPDHLVLDLMAAPELPAQGVSALLRTLRALVAREGTSFGIVCPHGTLDELPQRLDGDDVAVFATVAHALAHAPSGALGRTPRSRSRLGAQIRSRR